MTEPQETASVIEPVATGVWRWAVHDDRIDFISTAYAVTGDAGTVLIDPLPLAGEALAKLGEVSAIILTSETHQRSAWRYRRELGAKVWAPRLSTELDEEPDSRYGDGDQLPGGLLAVFTPGAGSAQHSLLLGGDPGLVFCPDLLVAAPGAELELEPDEYMDDPEEARRSIGKLLELPFAVLCLTHGPAIADDPKAAIRAALAAAA